MCVFYGVFYGVVTTSIRISRGGGSCFTVIIAATCDILSSFCCIREVADAKLLSRSRRLALLFFCCFRQLVGAVLLFPLGLEGSVGVDEVRAWLVVLNVFHQHSDGAFVVPVVDGVVVIHRSGHGAIPLHTSAKLPQAGVKNC